MGVNIFFSNGFMSALSSCFIVDQLYEKNPGDDFVLCIEENCHVSHVYYQLLDILVKQNKYFTQIIRVKVEFRRISLRSPIEYIRNYKYYKSIAKNVLYQIGSKACNENTTIWAPTTSKLWPFFKNLHVKYNLIEHGLGEYIQACSSNNKTVKNILFEYLNRLFGYPSAANYDFIWLCSYAVKCNMNKNVIQKNFDLEFATYVACFWNDYKIIFPGPASELLMLSAKVKQNKSNVYLYLPSEELNLENYNLFLEEQMEVLIPSQNALFVIKNHPGRLDINYAKNLKNYVNCINITETANCYIPAEFIVYILNVEHVVGSGSSTLFYLKSWLPETKIHIYNDYDPSWLTNECSQFKQHLDMLGLINKQKKDDILTACRDQHVEKDIKLKRRRNER